jgi:gliding motility-associated-like protein
MKKLIIQGWLVIFTFLPTLLMAQIPTNGLVAKYLFNGNANDVSGNKNDGTVYGPELTFDRCSNPNSAYYFNGINQYISLPPEKFLLNEYTYSVWIKVSSFPAEWDDGWMIFSPGSSNSGLCQGLSIHTLGEICGTSYNIGDNPHGCWAVSPPIETGKWFHLAYTRSYDVLKIYINGVLMPYRHTDVYLPYPNNQPANYGSPEYTALIGCRSNFKSDDYFLGVIDDLFVYNRPLSNAEILELYKSACEVGTIEGIQEVCAGQDNVSYQYPAVPGYTNYDWKYSGKNVVLVADSNNVRLDFTDTATSGTLTLEVTGNGVETITTQLTVTVDQLPGETGAISGVNKVCVSQTDVQYEINPVTSALSYGWQFTGEGAQISGTSEKISMNFSSNATSGQLTVYGINSCGDGPVSPAMLIGISSPPSNAGLISGVHEVCQNSGDNQFFVPEINMADNYIWKFSGEGATIMGNSDSANIYFFNDATSGNLTVLGTNNCGTGASSAEFPIIVKSCSEDPGSLNIPNAFSPNGDGINDVFVIRGLSSQSQLFVFDRSGKKCFQSDNYLNNWDGKDSEGKVLPSDTYWYILKVPGIQNEFKGFVYIKRF